MSISATQPAERASEPEVTHRKSDSALETLRVITWRDPLVDSLGFDPRSAYVEHLWLPVIGPTSTWLLRRLTARLEQSESGLLIDLEDTARVLGLGARPGRHSPLARAVTRCVTFELARWQGTTTLAVRRMLPPLARRHLVRLPSELQQLHDQWTANKRRTGSLDRHRLRARRLALGLVALGDPFDGAEAQLMGWGVHPSLAHDAVSWARARPTWPVAEPDSTIRTVS